ncbi:MAG: hydrogenase maturation nickel metallochaperone HypA [Bacteriovoracaceae bacterium]|nr:hydrogenase maturation nickel metallochaperone HypA [Bacteriovoracaceae bacterium]
MHELSLAQTLVESVTALAKKENATKVSSITISVGALSGVSKDSLEFCFPMATKDTFLASTKIIINEIPLTTVCSECEATTYPNNYYILCQNCQSTNVRITGGKEFSLVSMEVE